ncbi:helix-turn-helix domain-containing protein [Bacillus sp. USDA818B3_A]|uniref:helix-turn-helix domain-containing protein n=1 Tax=Bacillus sp. USDA818B3_A TaxID=2698834 RepID=UPI00136EBADB|nr:helix-turn-helix domain-containing protein [Bacillus sp. USDA818B3_A]
MLQLKNVILYCLKQLNNERTIYSIYHLLNGKKSSQTIQDAHLFSIKEFFGIYENLTRETFDQVTEELDKADYIEICGNQRYQITILGLDYLEHTFKEHYLNGWNLHSFTTLFWERLSLLIQVTSNLVYQEAKYIPIQKSKVVHNWLKSFLKEMSIPRKEIGRGLFSELLKCFDEAKNLDPSIVVFRLTGYQRIGLTPLQAARKLNMDEHDFQIEFINILHYLMQKIMEDKNRFMLLAFLTKNFEKENELTLSSRKTLNLLMQGYTAEEIAAARNLKLSTIDDHLVEFALQLENFSIDPFVDLELQQQILEHSRRIGTRQLKLIKDQLKSATYLQIRLVLAKHGE